MTPFEGHRSRFRHLSLLLVLIIHNGDCLPLSRSRTLWKTTHFFGRFNMKLNLYKLI